MIGTIVINKQKTIRWLAPVLVDVLVDVREQLLN